MGDFASRNGIYLKFLNIPKFTNGQNCVFNLLIIRNIFITDFENFMIENFDLFKMRNSRRVPILLILFLIIFQINRLIDTLNLIY